MERQFSIVIWVFTLIVMICAESLAQDVRVLGHRIPPFSMHDENGQVSGFSTELYALVFSGEETMPKKEDIVPVSFNRMYAELQKAPARVGITIGRNAKREKLFKWVGPYLTVRLGVIAKKKHHFNVETIKDFSGHKVATVENTAPEQALLKMGLPKDNLARSIYPKKNILNLDYGNVDFLAYPIQSASYLMNEQGIEPSRYEEVFLLRKIDLYFAFSPDFDDARIQGYQQKLDQVLQSEAYVKLKKKYVLEGIASYIQTAKQ